MDSDVLFPPPVRRTITITLVLLVAAAGSIGCQQESSRTTRMAENTLALDVDTTLTDTTYTLVNQDSSAVAVPEDILGAPILLGTIYCTVRCESVIFLW